MHPLPVLSLPAETPDSWARKEPSSKLHWNRWPPRGTRIAAVLGTEFRGTVPGGSRQLRWRTPPSVLPATGRPPTGVRESPAWAQQPRSPHRTPIHGEDVANQEMRQVLWKPPRPPESRGLATQHPTPQASTD